MYIFDNRFLLLLRLLQTKSIMFGSCSRSWYIVRLLPKCSTVGMSTSNQCSCPAVSHIPARSHATDSEPSCTDDGEFGRLAEKEGVTVFKLPPELRLPKEKDEDEKPRPKLFGQNTPYWYFLQCKKLAKQRKFKECVEFFEQKMLKEDRIIPMEYNYTVVIGALGRQGQVKKAFQLYRQMRDRALVPTNATYTGLVNAVAQCSDSKELRKVIGLYMKLKRRNVRLSRITYNSLIKAFGVHGTREQMMGIFRESIKAGFEPDAETFNMILFAMLKDKESGFRHAIQIWRQMLMLNVKPDGKSITYLLKILKNCGIGDPDEAYKKLIQDAPDPAEYKDFFKLNIRNVYWLPGQQSFPRAVSHEKLPEQEPELLTIEPGYVKEISEDVTVEPQSASNSDKEGGVEDSETDIVLDASTSLVLKNPTRPNLMTLPFDNTSGDNVPLTFKKCNYPHQRLALIGGYEYILDVMEKNEIKPTVMTLSALVGVLPPNSRRGEDDIIEFAEKYRLKLDTDFFNSILRRRAPGKLGHQDILAKMAELRLSPNYRTWCTSAMFCRRAVHGIELMNQIKDADVELDHIFFNSLLSNAIKIKSMEVNGYPDVKAHDYRYLSRILVEMKNHNIKADRKMIELLEKVSDWPEGYDRWSLSDPELDKAVFRYRRLYNNWLNNTEVIQQESEV